MIPRLRTWPRRILARPWLLSFVPINAATSGFGVMLPLYILLRLHGTLLDVALAAALFNGAVILASMLWGHLSDRYPRRRLFLLVNFAGFAVIYALLGMLPVLPLLFALYTVVGFLAPAGTSASNLLILEQFGEAERPDAFASFQEMSILGSIGGVLVGYFWLVAGGHLTPLLFVFAGLAAVSVGAVWFGIRPSATRASTRQVVLHPESLVSRVRHSVALHLPIPFFPRRPRLGPGLIARTRLWLIEEMRHELPIILVASFLFNFASNLFNTSYTPYLESVGIASASIFLVNCANNVAQAGSFPFSGGLANREGSDRLVHQSTYVRGLGYLAMTGFTFVPLTLGAAFEGNAIVFGILGAAIALYSTASSLILFRGLQGREAGTILGINSALGGVAAVTGALLSGYLSFYGSFRLTFFVSALVLFASLPLWTAAQLAYARRRGAAVPESVGPGPAAPVPPPVELPPPAPTVLSAGRGPAEPTEAVPGLGRAPHP
jgi:MFS family permease